MSLTATAITNVGSWPYVTARIRSFGDAGGLFLETAGAVTEDVHADGVYDYTDAEFADISGDLHGKVFPTLASSIFTTPPYYMFSIKHGDDIGIVSPYCAASPTMPGKLQIYAYDAVHGMPTGSPSTVTFSAISGTALSVIVSLAKVGTKYHAIHLACKRTVSGTAGEIAAWGVIHNADGTIDSATKIEKTLTYDTIRVPSTRIKNLGYATQNTWTVRIEKAGTAWTTLEAQIHTHVHGDPSLQIVGTYEAVVDDVTYYEATVVAYAVDNETPTITFRFTAGGSSTSWTAEYGFGDASVLLDTSSSTVVCYVERSDKELGYGITYQVQNTDPAAWKHEAMLAADSAFTAPQLAVLLPSEYSVYYYSRPFIMRAVNSAVFVARSVTDIYFRARACDCDAVNTDWSTTIHLELSATPASVSNRAGMDADSSTGEAWDSNYVKTVVTPWSDNALQLAQGSSKMQIRNIANADTLFTAFHRLTATVVSGVETDAEENELVAVGSSAVVQKNLTDATSGGFYATSAMSGENGVAFLTYDYDTGSILYHATFDDASPTDLGIPPLIPVWWALLNLFGTLSVLALGYLGTLYYRPVGSGTWQSIGGGGCIETHYMSIDPWGHSAYVTDSENGLVIRYITGGEAISTAYSFPWLGRFQLSRVTA